VRHNIIAGPRSKAEKLARPTAGAAVELLNGELESLKAVKLKTQKHPDQILDIVDASQYSAGQSTDPVSRWSHAAI
jgi:hypothetical protein